jgi:hypothetical protein
MSTVEYNYITQAALMVGVVSGCARCNMVVSSIWLGEQSKKWRKPLLFAEKQAHSAELSNFTAIPGEIWLTAVKIFNW